MSPQGKDESPLDRLEERIEAAVALVARLRTERDEALSRAAEAHSGAQAAIGRLEAEVESLRAERTQVRARLEKLLGHIDRLGAA